jgi:hypothetical protein
MMEFVRLDHHPNYWGKYHPVMFQTTKQLFMVRNQSFWHCFTHKILRFSMVKTMGKNTIENWVPSRISKHRFCFSRLVRWNLSGDNLCCGFGLKNLWRNRDFIRISQGF